jgi:hypothetical protein
MGRKARSKAAARAKGGAPTGGTPSADAAARTLRKGAWLCAALLGLYLAFLVFAFPRDVASVDPKSGRTVSSTRFAPIWASDSAMAGGEMDASGGRMVIVSRSGSVWLPALFLAAATVAFFWSAAWTARHHSGLGARTRER